MKLTRKQIKIIRKLVKIVFPLIAFLSLLFIIGTMGALEHDEISYSQAIIQSMLGVLFFGLSVWCCKEILW